MGAGNNKSSGLHFCISAYLLLALSSMLERLRARTCTPQSLHAGIFAFQIVTMYMHIELDFRHALTNELIR